MNPDSLAAYVEGFELTGSSEWTYDLKAFGALGPNDKEAAAQTLLKRALDRLDARALNTLAALGRTDVADAIAALAERPGPVGFAARRALFVLRGGDDELGSMLANLGSGPMVERFASVMALSGHTGAAARAALVLMLHDPDALVRSQTLDALVASFELEPLRLGPDGRKELMAPLNRLDLLVRANLESLWRPAAAELAFVVAALDRAYKPQDLGLVWDGPTRFSYELKAAFRAWLTGRKDGLPIAMVQASSPHDRAWVESMVAAQLQPPYLDARAPGQLAALGAAWSVPAIEEAMTLVAPDSAFSVAGASALAQLSGRLS